MAANINDITSTVTLNDGIVMPAFGLGTYRIHSADVMSFALQNGYRMLDTAAFYENEKLVGEAVKKSGLPRSDVFVVTKLLWDDHGYERCKVAFKESLKKLDLDYVDLYLIHAPVGGDILRTYDAMMELKSQGLIRSVGVSNFGIAHLEGLRKAGRATPSTNQIELHPMMQQQELVKYCREHNIAVMGFSPLAKGKKMNDELLHQIAARYNKSLAQLMIRWSVQKGYITIPKSSVKERIIENAQVFDWKIKDEDLKEMESLSEFNCTWNLTGSDWETQA